jgi:glycyl-tRNA synthetase beta chain
MPELLVELFSEEIPARMQARAAADLARLLSEGVKAAGLAHGPVRSFVTPRRVAVAIADIPARRPDVREEKRGPRVGAPEQAVHGFLKSAGLASLDQCERREVKGATYYFAVVEKKGGETTAALPEIVTGAIRALTWPKSMRWAHSTFAYVRPLHAVLAVFDGKVVAGKFEAGGGVSIPFGGVTHGHRFLAPAEFAVTSADEYVAKLRAARVLADAGERRAAIADKAAAMAKARGLALVPDEALLDEVTGLVEWPVPLIGRIDAESMALPPEVLVTAMRQHQKYFALADAKGAMAPFFLTVSNMETGDGGAATVAGNERVLRARLADARFFWDQDRKVRLDSRVKALDGITWHAKLGTVGEKVRRLEALVEKLCPHVPGADPVKVRRAALLAKADLTSGMVGEFPELQGTMGRYYARHDGEDEAVANAVAEHWGPLGPGDACPKAPVSVAVALADKIDSLVGFFAIDEKPTGSKDPYALRRAAQGVIRLVVENRLRVPLARVFAAAGAKPETAAVLLDFFADRLKVALRDKGTRHDLVDAVFALGGEDDLVRLLARVEALGRFVSSADGANLLAAYKRAMNIVRIEAKKDKVAGFAGAVDAARLSLPEERALAGALDAAEAASAAAVGREDFAAAMAALASLRAPVDAFFAKVTVNAPEPLLRLNRLRLLERIGATMNRIADFSRLEGQAAI